MSFLILPRVYVCSLGDLSKNVFEWRASTGSERYNIARVLALYESYWAAMNKILIYLRPPVRNEDFFHDDVFICFFRLLIVSTKYPKIYGNDENLSSIIGIELLATQTNSKSGEDVSQIIKPESLKTLP